MDCGEIHWGFVIKQFIAGNPFVCKACMCECLCRGGGGRKTALNLVRVLSEKVFYTVDGAVGASGLWRAHRSRKRLIPVRCA